MGRIYYQVVYEEYEDNDWIYSGHDTREDVLEYYDTLMEFYAGEFHTFRINGLHDPDKQCFVGGELVTENKIPTRDEIVAWVNSEFD